MSNDWCILRTSSRFTLGLAESLAEDGYEVWTPVETRLIRVPRKHTRREVKLPIMPSYVFAKAAHLIDLIQLADMPVKPRKATGSHADFNVMRAFGNIPLVHDKHLTKLRELEEELTPKPKPQKQYVQAFTTGERLRMAQGIFCGMIGMVERSDNAHTLLTFGARSVKFPTLLLRQDGVCEPDSAVRKEAA